jgi:ethanolamine utilization protein EutN
VIVARVVGRSWATVKHPIYEGRIVMAVAPIDAAGRATGAEFLAVDSVGACPGQRVLVAREGNTARQVLQAHEQPVHSVIIGIIDTVDTEETP